MNTQNAIVAIELHESTVELLDSLVAEENGYFLFSVNASYAWNRARFIDFLIRDYHESVADLG